MDRFELAKLVQDNFSRKDLGIGVSAFLTEGGLLVR